MGSYLSFYWDDPNDVNSVTGLTRYEVNLVQKSWKLINADPVSGGARIFQKLFREYPESKEFFRMIRNLHEDELAKNIQFRAHVLNFMSSFNLAITNLHQPEIVAASMNKLGESHGRRKLQEKQFKDLKIVLNEILRDDLKQNEPTINGWNKTVDFMCKHIFEVLNGTEEEKLEILFRK